MRAAFYSRCLDSPELVTALRDRQVVLGPMMAEGLREAVTSPAKAVGLQLEAGAVELMLRDLGVSSARARAGIGQRTYDAGALPLLSHAVLSTWYCPTGLPRDFLIASTRQWRRSVWVRRVAVAAVVAFALIAAQPAIRQRDGAVFRQVVTEADRMQKTDPSLSAQLDLVAHQMRPRDNDVYTKLVATQNIPFATPLVGHNGAVYLTLFSRDGHTLATASVRTGVRSPRIVANPAALGQPLIGHTGYVRQFVFSPNGRILTSASGDTVGLWDLCAATRNALTPEQWQYHIPQLSYEPPCR